VGRRGEGVEKGGEEVGRFFNFAGSSTIVGFEDVR
jgi:hypothetical protein